ncbi:hypothetical protein RJ639_021502 [Escallonia herrerae]|uniref:Reverse transcriptase n=1 Tax=Escallonia herrerae TaxID=1293975 RepID=A0AA89AG51_9ASTE|nr:hypothetical protein RJ639_021502 [Escallonia herrerae]
MPPKKKSDVPGKGLMYVDIKVNGKAIRAMVDTGATHNYISSTEVERLGLTLEKGCGRVKAINSAAQPVAGIARSILIKIGPNEGRTNFSVVIMDDFKLIIGLEFLHDTKTTVMPCTNSLAMLGNKLCVIPTISPRSGERSISALQWQELLAEFNFMLEYRAGSTNSVADALSRRVELDQFWQEDGLLMTKGRWVYVPRVDDLRRTLIRECHDTLWAGHAGGEITLALLQQSYYWPQMGDEVQEYVKTCLTCQQDKVERKKKAGLLQPLPVPKRPWESVSLDFITGLPKVEDLGTILIVIDRFRKYASFIATPKYCSVEDTTQLFFKYVVKYWGMPQDIVSDWDSRFTRNFWTELFKLFGSQLSMSSSYHLESDGQTERFNSMLEEYLCHFVNATQKNWVKLLDVAQLCFNSRKSSLTGKSASETVNGQQPLLPHTINVPNAKKSPRAISFSEEWRQNIDLAHSYLEKAARRMKKHADKNRRSQEFNVGKKVIVKIGKMAYKVDPPHWWNRQLHHVFHVNMLKPFYEDTADPSRGQIRRQGLKPKTAGKRVAEAILNDRLIIASRKRHQEYLVKWQGHMDEENTWERAVDLSAYADKIQAYHMQKLTRVSTALVGENVTSYPLHPPSTVPPRPSSSAPRSLPTCTHAPSQVLQVSRPCARQAQRPRAQLQCPCMPKANREDLKIQACIFAQFW